MTSLLASFALEDHMRGSGEKREVVFEYFGTFTRSFLSLFEVTLGNWAPIARLLHENVSEYFLPFILLYLSVVVFAVLNVIRAVFLHETLKVASGDDEMMILQKERAVRKYMRNMNMFFNEADADGDGSVTFAEFAE